MSENMSSLSYFIVFGFFRLSIESFLGTFSFLSPDFAYFRRSCQMQDELKDAILQEIPEAQMELVVGEDGEDEPTLEYKYYQL